MKRQQQFLRGAALAGALSVTQRATTPATSDTSLRWNSPPLTGVVS
jgi:hypothetical protein